MIVQFFALELPDAQIFRIRRPEREETPDCEVIASQGLIFVLHNLFFFLSCMGPFFVARFIAQVTLLHSFDFRTFRWFCSIFARMATTH